MPITLQANGEPFLKWSSSHSHSFSCLLSGLQTATVVFLLPRLSICKMTILTDEFVRPFGQIEQGAHFYSMRKAFLESTVVELVYKFDEE